MLGRKQEISPIHLVVGKSKQYTVRTRKGLKSPNSHKNRVTPMYGL